MRKIAFSFLMVLFLGMTACSKNGQIGAFIQDFDKITNEIVQKISTNPTAEGIDEAQKFFDSKKTDLKAKLDGFKGARGFQVNQETMTKLTDSITKNVTAVNGLKITYVEKTLQDENFSKKIDKLVNDFNSIFGI